MQRTRGQCLVWKTPRAADQPSLRATTTDPVLEKPRATAADARAQQRQRPPQGEACTLQLGKDRSRKENPGLPKSIHQALQKGGGGQQDGFGLRANACPESMAFLCIWVQESRG